MRFEHILSIKSNELESVFFSLSLQSGCVHECIFILVEFLSISNRYRFGRKANAFANNQIVCSAMSTIHSQTFYKCDGNSLEEELDLTDIMEIFQFGIELNPVNTLASKNLKI